MHYMHGQIPLKKAIRAPKLQRLVHICYLPGGRFVLGKTEYSRPTAKFFPIRTKFFPIRTNRPAKNVFILFFRKVLCKQFLCRIFTAAIFKPGVRVHFTFRK